MGFSANLNCSVCRSALFNLALLLADDHRPLEAAPFLNQLVRHHPDHVKGLILLGDIYINNIKDLDAAENVSLLSRYLIHSSRQKYTQPKFISADLSM